MHPHWLAAVLQSQVAYPSAVLKSVRPAGYAWQDTTHVKGRWQLHVHSLAGFKNALLIQTEMHTQLEKCIPDCREATAMDPATNK